MSEEQNTDLSYSDSTGIYRFHKGDWDGWVLHDCAFPPGPVQQYAVSAPDLEILQLMDTHFLPSDQFQLNSSPLLLRWNGQFILVDTGVGQHVEGVSGMLDRQLSRLGVRQEQINYVLITHLHIDHIGGAYSENRSLLPNAAYYVSEREADFWNQPDPDLSELRGVPTELIELTIRGARNGLSVLSGQIVLFKPDEELLPGITALSLPGHTPGHSGFHFKSGQEQFVTIGDAAHDPLLQLLNPGWTTMGDALRATTVETRKTLLNWLASERMRFHAYHFPFPSIGRVRSDKTNSYEFVPERWLWR